MERACYRKGAVDRAESSLSLRDVHGNTSFYYVYVVSGAAVPGRFRSRIGGSGVRCPPARPADDSPQPPRSSFGESALGKSALRKSALRESSVGRKRRPLRGVRQRDAALRSRAGRIFRGPAPPVYLCTRPAGEGFSAGVLAGAAGDSLRRGSHLR